MTAVTVIVEFETVKGAGAEFTRIMLDHAQRTLHEEPGCLRFEVIRPIDGSGRPKPNSLIVDELYADAAALAAHRANPRMTSLGATIRPLLKSRRTIEAVAVAEPHVEEGKRPEELNAANDD
jgi:quinol monooxygenase YgiN